MRSPVRIALAALGPGLGVAGVLAARAQEAPTAATPGQLALLEQILARPEFLANQGRSTVDEVLGPIRTMLISLLFELVRLLARLFDAGDGAISTTGIIVALAIVAAAAIVIVRLARRGLVAEAALAEAAASGPPRADVELARARALAQVGDHRGAVHHQYLAVLRRLDERGLIPFDGSLTNQEYLPRAAPSPALASALTPLVTAFDRLWYGQGSCSAEEYDRFTGLASRAWRAAESISYPLSQGN